MNLNLFTKNIVPYRIKATISYPEKVVQDVQFLKSQNVDLNHEDVNFIYFNGSSYHPGAVDLFHSQEVELSYSKEGNWWEISIPEINKLSNSRNYFYNFEINFFKAKDLINIQVLEYSHLNKNKDGIHFFKNEEYIFQLTVFLQDKNICLLLNNSSLDYIKNSLYKLFTDIEFDNPNIKSIFYNENCIGHSTQTEVKKAEGFFVLKYLNFTEDIKFSISSKQVF